MKRRWKSYKRKWTHLIETNELRVGNSIAVGSVVAVVLFFLLGGVRWTGLSSTLLSNHFGVEILHNHSAFIYNYHLWGAYHGAVLYNRWWFGVMLAGMTTQFGYIGYSLYLGLVLVIMFLVILGSRPLERVGVATSVSVAIFSVVAVVEESGFSPRFESYLLFLLLLGGISLGRTNRWFLWTIPILFLIGIYSGAILVVSIIVLLLEFLPTAEGGDQLSRKYLSLVVSVSVVAWVVVISQGSLSTTLSANMAGTPSPNFHSLITLSIVSLPIITLLIISQRGQKPSMKSLGLMVMMFVLGVYSDRYLAYYLLSWPWVIYSIRQTKTTRKGVRIYIPRYWQSWETPIRVVSSVWAVVVLLVIVPLSNPSSYIPSNSYQYISSHSIAYGRVFTTPSWGDYFEAQGLSVPIDTRANVAYGGNLRKEYNSVAQMKQNPLPLLDQWNITYVVWPKHSSLATFLQQSTQWKVVYTGRVGEVLQRQTFYTTNG